VAKNERHRYDVEVGGKANRPGQRTTLLLTESEAKKYPGATLSEVQGPSGEGMDPYESVRNKAETPEGDEPEAEDDEDEAADDEGDVISSSKVAPNKARRTR
jgi:hypothetical protein